ncbi:MULTISPECIES: N-acyl-D-amino-acid deacylase family protein [unclassified Sphingopyxis]|uniref:N-acyl-D-amino-acid deacylase family protein n=1 Tax=unclassified Sphingopyxis TaxID=2614943 RepID=UPI0007366812|nr:MULTISPECIES: amidohydrolase family protein [unclassified Sphingopyxis]KTE30881.1 amidohydrolase [Sphingopyxis sp. HIX]KTE74858.1 amidohydrolase [Sphingopyxis sp. HXXIV]
MALLSGAAALLSVSGAAAKADEAVDIIIRGGTIYDGGEGVPFVGDVAIRGDRIVHVGAPGGFTAPRIVDATGMIVAPGFVDPHTHADGFLRSPDRAVRVNAAWLNQGVTTVMIGVDGSGTPDVAADAAKLEASGIGTNVVSFVGFGPVRQRVLGQDARAPDAAELDRMKALVAKGMCEGAVGLSTGLFYAPQSFATTGEVVAVAREAATRGGIYDTHQRDESSYSIGLLGSVQEVIDIGRQAGMPVHFAHLKALGVDVHGQAGAVIAAIEKARADGIDVTADQYPWLASGSNLDASLLPRWAVDGGGKALLKRLDDPATLAKIRGEMAENLRRRGGAAALLLISEGYPWTGQTLEQVAAAWKLDSRDAALRIMRASVEAKARGESGGGTGVASFNMAQADVDLLMKQPWMVTSSDGSDGHPRMFATFPEKYLRYVRERKVIDLATFIRQSTGRTADIYKLDRRGYLRAGYFADVLVFDPEGYAPRADYVRPRELSVGVDKLFVNGQLAVDGSRATGVAAGRALLRLRPPGCDGRS